MSVPITVDELSAIFEESMAGAKTVDEAERRARGALIHLYEHKQIPVGTSVTLEPVCLNCRSLKSEHVATKCLFEPTQYKPGEQFAIISDRGGIVDVSISVRVKYDSLNITTVELP